MLPSESNPPLDLTTQIASGFSLSSPIISASGVLGWGTEAADLIALTSLGAFVTPTLTREARAGGPMPRTAECSAGLLYAAGLPNPGLDLFLTDTLPLLSAQGCPIVASVHAPAGGWGALCRELAAAGGVAALELSLSPLEFLEFAEPPGEAALLAQMSEAVAEARSAVTLPLVAKLPTWRADAGRLARAAEEAGADAVVVGQGFPGVAVRLSSGRFRLPGVAGQLSGPAVKPLALYEVWRAAGSVKIPVIGGGGITTGEDALEFLLTGASVVAIGTACLISPAAPARIASELAALLPRHGFASAREAVGAANR